MPAFFPASSPTRTLVVLIERVPSAPCDQFLRSAELAILTEFFQRPPRLGFERAELPPILFTRTTGITVYSTSVRATIGWSEAFSRDASHRTNIGSSHEYEPWELMVQVNSQMDLNEVQGDEHEKEVNPRT